MNLWVFFRKFFEIERKIGSNIYQAFKTAFFQAYKTKLYHYRLLKDFKMSPIFFYTNRYYTQSHDSANVDLRLEFFKEMKKKQIKRSEINTKTVETLISRLDSKKMKKSEKIYLLLSKIKNAMHYTERLKFIKNQATEMKSPQSVKENLQEWILYSVKLYHESLQNLIEGQREVLRDKNFIFDDNKSVDDKMTKFEEYLKEKIPRIRRKTDNKIENTDFSSNKEEKL